MSCRESTPKFFVRGERVSLNGRSNAIGSPDWGNRSKVAKYPEAPEAAAFTPTTFHDNCSERSIRRGVCAVEKIGTWYTQR